MAGAGREHLAKARCLHHAAHAVRDVGSIVRIRAGLGRAGANTALAKRAVKAMTILFMALPLSVDGSYWPRRRIARCSWRNRPCASQPSRGRLSHIAGCQRAGPLGTAVGGGTGGGSSQSYSTAMRSTRQRPPRGPGARSGRAGCRVSESAAREASDRHTPGQPTEPGLTISRPRPSVRDARLMRVGAHEEPERWFRTARAIAAGLASASPPPTMSSSRYDCHRPACRARR